MPMTSVTFYRDNKTVPIVVELTKPEASMAVRLANDLRFPESWTEETKRVHREEVQKSWDIWARSAPTEAAKERRKAVARALGLSDEIKFL